MLKLCFQMRKYKLKICFDSLRETFYLDLYGNYYFIYYFKIMLFRIHTYNIVGIHKNSICISE